MDTIRQLVPVPRVFLTTPFFTVAPQPGWQVKSIEDGQAFTYLISNLTLDEENKPTIGNLTIDEFSLMLALLGHAQEEQLLFSRFGSLRTLGDRMFVSDGGLLQFAVMRRMRLLRATDIVRRPDVDPRQEKPVDAPTFNIIADHDIAQRSKDGDWVAWDRTVDTDLKYRASWVQFSHVFSKLMVNTLDVDADQYFAIESPLARACWLYLPSTCFPLQRFTPYRPRRFTLEEILRMVGAKIPSRRAEIIRAFVREERKHSIERQLDGALLARGKFRFRLRLDLPVGPSAEMWVELDPRYVQPQQTYLPLAQRTVPKSKLEEAWIEAGGTQESWDERMQRRLEKGILDRILSQCVDSGVYGSPVVAQKHSRALAKALRVVGVHGINQAISVTVSETAKAKAGLRQRIDKGPAAFFMGCVRDQIRIAASNGPTSS